LALNAKKKAEDRSEKALQQKGIARGKHESKPPSVPASDSVLQMDGTAQPAEASTLFDSGPATPTLSALTSQNPQPYFITPTTSHPPLPMPPIPSMTVLPRVPRPYPLFCYLHSKGYFMTPGLRFGCHYTVYPGDPLRYHSHFLATGLDWDEEFDLLDVVGGGRLGTGVKKAYLIGGRDPSVSSAELDLSAAQSPKNGVRAFSIEWAGL
jgi:tRNA-splicing endonuclease subunit Sen34